MKQKYKSHPIADRLPEMTEDEFSVLKDSISRDGLLHPIILYDSKILDGRHRLRACEELRITPQFVQYSGTQPATLVFVNNVARRQLTIPQKLRLLDSLLPDIEAESRRRRDAGTLASMDAKGKTSAIAAKLIGVSPATVERDRAIQRTIERLETSGRDDAADKVRQAAAKSVRAGAKAAAAAEMMLEAEPELLNRLRHVLSPQDIQAIENGTIPLSTEDLQLWTTADPEEAQGIKALVVAHRWKVSTALKFVRHELTVQNTIGELTMIVYSLLTGNLLGRICSLPFRRTISLPRAVKNPPHLSDRFGILICAVTRRHNLLRSGSFEMRAPIRHNTIAAIRRVAASAIADNRVIRNAFFHRESAGDFHPRVVRRKRVDAVRDSSEFHHARVLLLNNGCLHDFRT